MTNALSPAVRAAPATSVPSRAPRLVSVDLVRGLVMVLMALDHARNFVSADGTPEDMQHTDLALFLTRWVTHFCAPLFFLLAGVAACLYGRRAGAGALRRFLVTRGPWLIALELTVIGFAWSFHGLGFGGVIWCLGWSFLSLAALAFLGPGALLALGAAVIALHDLADGLEPGAFGSAGFLYALAHRAGVVRLPGGGHWFVLFPWIPWMAVMWLGYGLGPLFERPAAERRRTLALAGAAMLALFVGLRATNAYGNPSWASQHGGPGHFAPQESAALTLVAFLNTEKYPPSLQFLLMTLGPGFLLLAVLARRDEGGRSGWLGRVLTVYGRTPFLFYLLHLYAFHLAAKALGGILGWNDELYGFGLAGVYAVWLGVTARAARRLVAQVPVRRRARSEDSLHARADRARGARLPWER